MILRWMWDTDPGPTHPPVDIGDGHQASRVHDGPRRIRGGRRSSCILVAAAIYGALVFSYFYLWTVSPERWPAAECDAVARLSALAAAALLALAGGAIAVREPRARHAMRKRPMGGALVIALGGAMRGLRRRPRRDARERDVGRATRAMAPSCSRSSATQGLYVVVVAIDDRSTRWPRRGRRRLDRVRRATFDNTMLIGYYTVAQGRASDWPSCTVFRDGSAEAVAIARSTVIGLRMLSGALIWAVHFMAIYGFTTLALRAWLCLDRNGWGSASLRWVVGGATVLALAAALCGHRRGDASTARRSGSPSG